MQTKLLIGGDFITGEGQDLAILDPAGGNTIANISRTDLPCRRGCLDRVFKMVLHHTPRSGRHAAKAR
ncbi:MAG: hypothetical protein JSW26_01835 [Desulfobacterales bacterium]|nr:MAG: hypothetical protein JSW26_01835 [Desulfobacterales bacterium]